MSVLSPAMFEGLCSADSAQQLLQCHLEQRTACVSDSSLPGLDFDLRTFFRLLRDRRWHSQDEIKFYGDERAGPSVDVWSQAIRANGSLSLDSILHLKKSKTSIYVKRLELMDQGLRELAAQIAKTGYFNATLSAMFSPAGARSTPNHIDTCDVLAIQLHGEKSWTVDSRPRMKNALPRQTEARPESFEFLDAAEYTTRVGDALFVPRGFLHNAMANEHDSLHLVIGLLPLTWFDVMADIVQELCDSDPECRAAIFDRMGRPDAARFRDDGGLEFASLFEPDALKEASGRVMRKRAREHMLNSFGQVFASSADDLV